MNNKIFCQTSTYPGHISEDIGVEGDVVLGDVEVALLDQRVLYAMQGGREGERWGLGREIDIIYSVHLFSPAPYTHRYTNNSISMLIRHIHPLGRVDFFVVGQREERGRKKR